MRILDDKYKKADLPAIIDNITTINQREKSLLLRTMKKYKQLFNRTLGNFYCKPAKLPMKHCHNSPYHAPRAKKELDCLVLIVVLKQNANSQHAYLTFIIPKKDGKVRFVSDF